MGFLFNSQARRIEMKHLRIGKRQATMVDAPDPHAEDDWVVIKIHAAPLCTEYKLFVSDREAEGVGHEAAGEVVEVAQPGPLKVGDRVLVSPQVGCGVCYLCSRGDYIHCQSQGKRYPGKRSGGHLAQYITKPAHICPVLPDDIDYIHGSLAGCALGPAFNAAMRMNVTAFDSYLITGMGPVGLGALTVGKFRNAKVIAVESVPFRQEKAKELGADHVLDPNDPDVLKQIMDITDGKGVEKALDCSGNEKAERLCIDAAMRRGDVAFVGENGGTIPISPSRDFIRKGITLHGIWHWNLHDFPEMMDVIRRSPNTKIGKLISHVLPMSRAQEAFELCAEHKTAKVILKPWE
jgi:L-iditol 2-dehydrogenase